MSKPPRQIRARHGDVIDRPRAGSPMTKSSYNRQLVRAILHRHGSASRVELGELTGLKLPVLTHVCTDLLAQGLVRETAAKAPEGGIGRRRVLLEIDYSSLGAVTLVYDAAKVDIAVFDLLGTLRWRRIFSGPFQTVKALEEALAQAVAAALASSPFQLGRMLALGVGDPGIIDRNGRSLRAANIPGWHDQPIRERLSRIAKLPVFFDRDAGFEALGEAAFGTARDSRCTLFVTSNHGGIGGALLEGRRLIQGRLGSVGEIGHVYAGGDQLCACGLTGCLETWMKPSRLAELTRQGLGDNEAQPLDVSQFISLIHSRNPVALRVLADAAIPLARVLGGIIHLMNPDMIVFAGQLTPIGPDLCAFLRTELPRFTIPELLADVRLETSQLASNASFLGMIASIREDLFALPAGWRGL